MVVSKCTMGPLDQCCLSSLKACALFLFCITGLCDSVQGRAFE